MALNLRHQTANQFADRFWARVKEAYRNNDKQTFHYCVWWIWDRVQKGDFTNDQVRLSFNQAYNRSLTLAQWNAFVTSRLIPIKDRYLAFLNEADL